MSIKILIIVSLLLGLSSCTSETEYGACVGLDDSDRQPGLTYKVSVRNAFWSAIGFETVIAPILWVTDYMYCPVGVKLEASPTRP